MSIFDSSGDGHNSEETPEQKAARAAKEAQDEQSYQTGGDYSQDAAAKARAERERLQREAIDKFNDPNNPNRYQDQLSALKAQRSYIGPGATDYGGRGGVEYYKQQAIAGGKENDAAQAANQAAMESSWSNLRNDRGPQAVENDVLSGRAANTRYSQMQALGLSRDAAMGKAPSEADFQTRIGMNDNMAQMSGQMGSARGLSALGGSQGTGAAALGQSSGNLAMAGGLARSKEIGDAIGMYGTQAGQVRGQDLSRLQQNSQNAMFNAKNNDDWKLGNAGLLAQQGQLGNAQAGTDMAWMGERQRGTDKQFEYDQRMAAIEAGADADAVGAAIAKNREDKENKRQLVNGGVTAGLTAIGSLGGPAGAAGGAAAGSAFSSSNKNWDW